MDNGLGKLRGIYAEGNVAAVPLLKEWLAPYASLGAGRVVAATTGGTDHVFMQSVGVPGYQFIQDPLDYGSTTHHSSADTYENLQQAEHVTALPVWAGNLPVIHTSEQTHHHPTQR